MTSPRILLALLSLWTAVAVLAYLVVRELGWARIRQRHWLAVPLLLIALAALPGAGAWKITQRYRARILAMVFRTKSPSLEAAQGCPIFPANNIWNTPVQELPVDANSAAYIRSMGGDLPLHADFAATGGIPYAVTKGGDATQVTFPDGGAESDAGPYSIPDDAPIEPGGDGHVLVVDTGACRLYELFAARRVGPGRWEAVSGASFDLRSNTLRPESWTSADGAGLPIFPGLARYEEVKAGRIAHALRFTTRHTQRAFTWPARHYASQSHDPSLPPMGLRLRLRGTFDLGPFSPETRVFLTALQQYGMMLADNGGPWFITGAPDARWSSTLIRELRQVKGSDFEAVDVSSLMINPASAEARR